MIIFDNIFNRFKLTKKLRINNVAEGIDDSDVATVSQLIDIGEWALWPFDANDYTATGGTFVADNLTINKYKVIGKTLFWNATISGTGGSTPGTFVVTLPNGYVSKNNGIVPVYIGDGASEYIAFLEFSDAVSTVSITKVGGGTFSNGATYFGITLTLEIE